MLSISMHAVTLAPANWTVVEGANANFNCSPLSEDIVLSSIAPGSDVSVVITSANPQVNISDAVDARLFTWLNASRSDNGRKFYCANSNMTSDTSTLTVHCKLVVLCYISDSVVYVPLFSHKSLVSEDIYN